MVDGVLLCLLSTMLLGFNAIIRFVGGTDIFCTILNNGGNRNTSNDGIEHFSSGKKTEAVALHALTLAAPLTEAGWDVLLVAGRVTLYASHRRKHVVASASSLVDHHQSPW